jgi:O-antigen ligase
VFGILVVIWLWLRHLGSHGRSGVAIVGQAIGVWLRSRLGWVLLQRRWSTNYALIAALGFMAIGLFVTFSRSAWLVGMAGIGLLLVWMGAPLVRPIFSRRRLAWVIGGFMVASIVLGPMIWSRFSSLDDTDRLSVERRVQLNEVAVQVLEAHTWLGVGVNNFITHLAQFGPLYGVGIWREPVHNLYLLIAVETGWVGILLWIVAHVAVGVRLVRLFQKRREDQKMMLLITLWLVVILLGLIDHYWWTSQPGWLAWWLLFGGSMAIIQIGQRESSKRQV